MSNKLMFGDRPLGDGHPCYVIAEAGANHNRDLEMAHRLVEVAADAGADAVKFQTYTGKALYSSKTPRFDYLGDLADKPLHELLDDIALPRDWQRDLADHAAELGIQFFSSPFDLEAVAQLDALDVVAFKVASFELVDLPFITAIGAYGRPMIISTGMATLAEIDEAIVAARSGGTDQLCLLQCASVYPAPAHVMNLRTIPTMKAAFGVPVGLSDHTTGLHVAAAAVALGANLLEKHFTLDRSLKGPDHPFAIEPDELKALVAQVRDVEAAMGDGLKQGPTAEEAIEMHAKARRSIVASTSIPTGTRITHEMLTTKRPGHGVKPKYVDFVVGRQATVDIDEDEVITWDML